MKSKLEGSCIYNATIICHEDIKSAAYMDGRYVELYGNGFTARIDDVDIEDAMRIFKHFNIKWYYPAPPSQQVDLGDNHRPFSCLRCERRHETINQASECCA